MTWWIIGYVASSFLVLDVRAKRRHRCRTYKDMLQDIQKFKRLDSAIDAYCSPVFAIVYGVVIAHFVSGVAYAAVDSVRRANWPDTWDIFGYFLPPRVRERVYNEARADLLCDHRKATRKYTHKGARYILNVAWTFRSFLLVLDCWRCLITEKTIGTFVEGIRALFRK